MAKDSKKVKDPTEVALSAIQEALNIGEATANAGRSPLGGELSPPTMPTGTPAFPDGSLDGRPGGDRPAFDSIEDPRGSRRAANDDRATIGQLLQAIQKNRPARR